MNVEAMAEALGDRAGEARACGNLGLCYYSTGDYGRAREQHEQHRAMCEALGDRAGVARACGNLAKCCLNTGDYGRAISYFTQPYNMAKEMQVGKDQAEAALGMGVVLRLEVRANVRGRAAGASELPGPHASASACNDDGVRVGDRGGHVSGTAAVALVESIALPAFVARNATDHIFYAFYLLPTNLIVMGAGRIFV